MSLVADFVKCEDGQWYENLTYMDETDHWFVCFDDDDPPEIVVHDECARLPSQILDELGIKYSNLHSGGKCGRTRMQRGGIGNAEGFFFHVENAPLPTPGKFCTYDQVYDKSPQREGVYYGSK